jgi:hypothetical protein
VGILVWFAAAVAAFVAGRLLDFGRFHPAAELLIAVCGALTAGAAATWLDFGGWGEADIRAFVFCALVASLSIALTRLAIAAMRWPEYSRRKRERH